MLRSVYLILQCKHRAARPATYTTDEVMEPQQAMYLMVFSLLNQDINTAGPTSQTLFAETWIDQKGTQSMVSCTQCICCSSTDMHANVARSSAYRQRSSAGASD
jgi:hypothetical protein